MYVVDQEAVDVRGGTGGEGTGHSRIGRWDRDRFASGAAESKLQSVRDYLQREFPFATVFDTYDAAQGAHIFRLENDHGTLMHVAGFTVEVLERETEGGLRTFLDRHKMFNALSRAGQRPVAVTEVGIAPATR